MGLRFRRSVSLGRGARLSVSKTGFGASVGKTGMRISVHTSGRRTSTVGAPGSGLSYVARSSGGRSGGSSRARSRAASIPTAQAAAVLPRPGLLSGKAEKRYHEGIQAYLRGDQEACLRAMEDCLAADSTAVSPHFFAAICAGRLGRSDAEQIRHLEAVVQSDIGMPDRLQLKYLPPAIAELSVSGKITEHITAEVPLDAAGASLILAEHYQGAGRLEQAIGVVQQLHEANPDDPVIRVSLADLLMADRDYEGVLEVAAMAMNASDLGVALLHLRGAALFALGHETAALDAFRDALAKTSGRDAELLKVVRYDRALAYVQAGQMGRARQDLERIYATDPEYLDVRDRLAAMVG